MITRALALCLLLNLAGCSHEAADHRAEADGEGGSEGQAATPALVLSTPRCELPAAREARLAVEEGRVEDARALMRAIETELGVERLLLEARIAATQGDDVRVSQLIERAREEAPDDARVYATSAELHAASGRLETAQAECIRGSQLCGMTPELERARGVQLICTMGAIESGLRLLETALGHDPELPFIRRPLCQAYRLVGQKKLGMAQPVEAYRHARMALEFGATDPDARRLMAECQIALGDHAAAASSYQALVQAGESLTTELASAHKNAGVAALLTQDRAAAVKHFLAARLAGMSDFELGTGKSVLVSEARLRALEARKQYEAGDLDAAKKLAHEALEMDAGCAEARVELGTYATLVGLAALREQVFERALSEFELALEYDPDSLEAHNYMGHVLIELGKPARAAEAWSWVVDTARLEGLELPEPVHLLLARAHTLNGDISEARVTLEKYLTLEPQGAFIDKTRTLLAALPEGD